MYTKFRQFCEPYLKTKDYGPKLVTFFQEYKKIVNTSSCLICGGFGHIQGPECPSVLSVINSLTKLGYSPEAEYFRKEFILKWGNF
jgi:hypothetical protein